MMKRLLLCVVLAGAMVGCRTFGERPTPAACPEPGPVPKAPPVQTLPPGATPPPGATQIVVGLCPQTGTFVAAGVNLKAKSFTYLVKGDRSARESFLANAYKAGVPVVLYTSPVKVAGGRGSTSSASTTAGAVASSPGTGSGDEEPTFDPCIDGTEIGDDPPEDPKDQGGAAPKPIDTFTKLSWSSANAIEGVSDPAPASTPTPGTSVPR